MAHARAPPAEGYLAFVVADAAPEVAAPVLAVTWRQREPSGSLSSISCADSGTRF